MSHQRSVFGYFLLGLATVSLALYGAAYALMGAAL